MTEVLAALPLLVALAPAGLPELHHPPPSRPFALAVEGAALLPFGGAAELPSTVDRPDDDAALGPGGAARLSLSVAPDGSRFLSLGGELALEHHALVRPDRRGGTVRAGRVGGSVALAMPGRGGGPVALELSLGLGALVGRDAAWPALRPTAYGAPAAKLLVRADDGLELLVGAALLVAPGALRRDGHGPESWASAGPIAGVRLWR